MPWLLDPQVQLAMDSAPQLSQAQIDAAMAAIGGPTGNPDRVLQRAGDAATISITGVMTTTPSWIAYYFGGGNTLYGDLDAAITAAEADPSIKSVDFVINSGGGEAQPAVDLGDRIAAMKKPTRALVQTAASAAYWAASQADKVVALSRATRVGSIGAVQSVYKPSVVSTVDVTSTDAPNKRPDPETEEGKAAIRTELDQFHELFATAVAVGRDKSVETVNNEFGRGGMMLAQQALDVGMIDAIGMQSEPKKPAKAKTTATGARPMDLAELQAQHPALYAQALAEGHKQGVAAELDRVKFHAKMGKNTGATEFAFNAIAAGTAKDDGDALAEYLTHKTNNADLADRQRDEQLLAGNDPALAGEEAAQVAALDNIFGAAGAALGVDLEA